MARLEAGLEYFAFCSLCQPLISLFVRNWASPPGLPGRGALWKYCKVLGQKNCLLRPRAVSSNLPEEILRITRRVQTLLCSLALCGACFLPYSWGRQAKPAGAPPQQTQPKGLPTGPPAAHSTHFPILLLGFGNQPNWSVRIGSKGAERLDRDGYPPIALEPGEVTRDAAPESWTYHAKDSATGAPVAVHLSREACTDAANDTLTATPPLGGKYSFKVSIDHAQLGSLKGCARIAAELFPKSYNQPDQTDDETKKKPPVAVSSVTKFQSPVVVSYFNASQQLAFKRGSIVRDIPGGTDSDLRLSHDGKKLLFTREAGAVRAINEYTYDSNSVKELLRGEVRNPVWSPEDSRVAYLNHQGGKWQLWTFPSNDPAKAAVLSADAFESIQGWSDPHILVTVTANQADLAWIGEDGKPAQALPVRDLCGPDFVPGAKLTVRLHPSNPDLVLVSALFARPAAGIPAVENGQAGALFLYEFRSKRRTLVPVPNLSASEAEWSRDGFQIFFTGTDSAKRRATYRIFWDGIGLQRYIAGTSLVVGL